MFHEIPDVMPIGLGDRMLQQCVLYSAQAFNPYDVTSTTEEERKIQFLKSSLWDLERSLCEDTAMWKYRLYEAQGAVPLSDRQIAGVLYDFAVRSTLDALLESTGIDFRPLYSILKGS